MARAAAALADVEQVPGRFEPIDEGQPFGVLVDYAHTPDSVENVLKAARRLTEGSLISVLGCGGDRDRDKRPLMGRASADLADVAVITSDNPRSEDPAAIVEEIVAGIEDRSNVVVEVDRRAAIALALGRASEGDVVVIAGKGHEQGQEFEGGRKIPFDDRDVARDELRRLAAARPMSLGRGRRRGGDGGRAARPRPRRAARRARSSTPRRPGPATCSSGCRARSSTAGSSRSTRCGPGPGGWWPGPQWAREIVQMRERGAHDFDAWVLGAADPLAALQDLARHRRRELGCPVIGITGSTGKTSVKDICASLLPVDPVHASPENFNTEIGLPLSVLGAPADAAALVLEMGMRGRGPDRRARGDRRARRRRDHQRRPGPRRAARLDRGRRRDQGRAGRRAARGGDRRRPGGRGPAGALRRRTRPGLLRFGDGGDVYASESGPARAAGRGRWW